MVRVEKALPVHVKKSEDFKTICLDGVYGGLNGLSGFVGIYSDELEQEADDNGIMRPVSITRTIHTELRMNPEVWIGIAQWMQDNAEGLKKFRQDQLDKLIKEKIGSKK